MSLYYFPAARGDDQLNKMQDLETKGICIFCPESLSEIKKEIIFTTRNWIVKHNGYPYKSTKLHVLIVPKKHVATISELPKETQAEFLPLVSRCEKQFNLKSYGLAARSGDMRYNGASVEHLHFHLVVGDIESEDFEPVRFKLSSRPS